MGQPWTPEVGGQNNRQIHIVCITIEAMISKEANRRFKVWLIGRHDTHT